MSGLQPYLEGYKQLPPPASWLRRIQESALERANRRGFPAPRDEAWKYSSTALLEKRAFAPARRKTTLGEAALGAFAIPGLDAPRLTFVDGRYESAHSNPPAGLRVTVIDSAATTLEESLTAPPGWEDDTFLNLNTALFRDGLLLELAPGTVLEKPLELLHVSTSGEQGSSHHPRVLLRLAKGARATLIERYVGLESAKNFTNTVMQLELAESSSLEHVRIQTESAQGFHVGRVLVKQKAGSEYRSHNLQLGGQWVRLDLHTRLEEEGARAVLGGLYAVNGRQHADNHTRIDHLAPGTLSEELYRGILDGQGRAVFNGKVVVAKHAVKTDARQANHNLLLSRGAEIDTKPELQIDADDVKCSHGASIGQLDEQQLFYLRSRGLDAEGARSLLIAAFAEQLIAALPHPALADHARRKLSACVARAALPELP